MDIEQVSARYKSLRNKGHVLVTEALAGYSDDELRNMVEALAHDRPFPPLWKCSPPHGLKVLAAPAIYAELHRRFEVAQLEDDPDDSWENPTD
jgi:hypothetical protein